MAIVDCVVSPLKTYASDIVCRLTNAECQAIQDKVCMPNGPIDLKTDFDNLIADTLGRNYEALHAASAGELQLNLKGCNNDPTLPTAESLQADLMRLFDTMNCEMKRVAELASLLCGGDPCKTLTGAGWVNKGVKYNSMPFIPLQTFPTLAVVPSYSGYGVNFDYTNTSSCRKAITVETTHGVLVDKIAGPSGDPSTTITAMTSDVTGAGVFMASDLAYLDDQGTIGLGDGAGAERAFIVTTRAIAVVDPGNTVTFTARGRVTSDYGCKDPSEYIVSACTMREEDAI